MGQPVVGALGCYCGGSSCVGRHKIENAAGAVKNFLHHHAAPGCISLFWVASNPNAATKQKKIAMERESITYLLP